MELQATLAGSVFYAASYGVAFAYYAHYLIDASCKCTIVFLSSLLFAGITGRNCTFGIGCRSFFSLLTMKIFARFIGLSDFIPHMVHSKRKTIFFVVLAFFCNRLVKFLKSISSLYLPSYEILASPAD